MSGSRGPGVAGYVLAGVIAVAAAVGAIALMLTGVLGADDGLVRVPAGSSATVDLEEGGYTVYVEGRTTFRPRVPFPLADPGAHVLGPSGERVPLQPYVGEETYDLPSGSGTAVATFRVPVGGRYEIVAGRADLAVGTGVFRDIGLRVLGALGLAFAGVVTATAVGAVTFARRRRWDRAQRAASADGAPPGPASPAQTSPAPGWYPDPGGTGALRWWDGTQWTGHLSRR